MEITRIKGESREVIIDKLQNAFKDIGFNVHIHPVDKRIHLSDFRLSDKWVEKKGYNVSPYTGRKGRILGWKNWVKVNDTINKVLDKLHVSANVHSLHGKFRIREGKKKFTEEDWEDFARENVGSIVEPVSRRNAWLSEKQYEYWKAIKLAEVL